MTPSVDARFGPHTSSVEQLLNWIAQAELLRFKGSLQGPFIAVGELRAAMAIAQGGQAGTINWTDVRDREDASLYAPGLLDSPEWWPFKSEIEQLPFYIDEKVRVVLPGEFKGIIDDAISDLNSCALCLAVRGSLNAFHELLWNAYRAGGWPCGCTGEDPETPDYELNLDGRQFYVLWRRSS